MVKRILKVKTSPDVRRGLQEKHFALHEKYKVLMAKIHPVTTSSAARIYGLNNKNSVGLKFSG